MNPDSIRLFKDIAHTKSFSRAAKLNDISQSAASQQVQELERVVAVALVDRSRRPLVVTEAGHLFAEYCRDLLRRREEFDAALARLKQDLEGTVRVASIYSIGLSEIALLEREYSRRFPQAHLEVQYLRPERVLAAVLEDQADLGLLSYPERSREIQVIPWRREEMVLATAADHPLARKAAEIQGPLPPAELNGVDFVSFDEELPIRRDVDNFLRELGVTVNVAMQFDNLQMIKEAVSQRLGVSLLPARLMREEIRQRRLASIRIAGAELYRPLGIIHRKRKRFNQVAQAFLDLLREKPTPEAA